MLIVGKTDEATAAIRSKLADSGAFWIHVSPQHNAKLNGYAANPPQVEGDQEGALVEDRPVGG